MTEAPAASGGGGIQFDTEPQAGQWLYVETNGPATTPTGFGIEFNDLGSDGGIQFYTDAGGGASFISLNQFGDDDIILRPADEIKLQGDTRVTTGIFTVDGTDVDLTVSNSAKIGAGFSDGYRVEIDDAGGIVFTSTAWGGPFLQVVQVGPTIEFHMLSGAVWVADL